MSITPEVATKLAERTLAFKQLLEMVDGITPVDYQFVSDTLADVCVRDAVIKACSDKYLIDLDGNFTSEVAHSHRETVVNALLAVSENGFNTVQVMSTIAGVLVLDGQLERAVDLSRIAVKVAEWNECPSGAELTNLARLFIRGYEGMGDKTVPVFTASIDTLSLETCLVGGL